MIIPSFHTEQLKEGEGDVIWTIYLKNGDTLRLRHTVKITRVPVVTLTENDYPMATVDDLNVLLDASRTRRIESRSTFCSCPR